MKYTLISINDSRQIHHAPIHEAFSHIERVQIECVNGSDKEQVARTLAHHGFDVKTKYWTPQVGHIGVFLSVLNAQDQGEIITVEDDAMIGPYFKAELWLRFNELPEDADFFSLFIPRDSDHMYNPTLDAGDRICKMYATYGGVSMLHTEKGIDKFRWLLKRDGISQQWDNMIYAYARTGELNCFTSKPTVSDLILISGGQASLVQGTEEWHG